MTNSLLSDITDSAKAFVAKNKSIILASAGTDGKPLASYAPFYRNSDGNFYIYVSTLSAHTRNLENAFADILLIDDEHETTQIYARNRISFSCETRRLKPTDNDYETILDKLFQRHGEIVTTLRGLADFRLFELSPTSGVYVRGFGQAYEIDAKFTVVAPIKPDSS